MIFLAFKNFFYPFFDSKFVSGIRDFFPAGFFSLQNFFLEFSNVLIPVSNFQDIFLVFEIFSYHFFTSRIFLEFRNFFLIFFNF